MPALGKHRTALVLSPLGINSPCLGPSTVLVGMDSIGTGFGIIKYANWNLPWKANSLLCSEQKGNLAFFPISIAWLSSIMSLPTLAPDRT
nr:hypothetical protein Q903MT_gene198 [Picea sitchensis]